MMKSVTHAVAKREIAALLIDCLGDVPRGERFDQIDFAEQVELVVTGAIPEVDYELVNLRAAKTLTKRQRERIIAQIWPITKLIGERIMSRDLTKYKESIDADLQGFLTQYQKEEMIFIRNDSMGEGGAEFARMPYSAEVHNYDPQKGCFVVRIGEGKTPQTAARNAYKNPKSVEQI